jgi:hypothetical protein
MVEGFAPSHDKVMEDVVRILARYGFGVHREYRVYYWDTVAGRPRRRYIELDVPHSLQELMRFLRYPQYKHEVADHVWNSRQNPWRLPLHIVYCALNLFIEEHN